MCFTQERDTAAANKWKGKNKMTLKEIKNYISETIYKRDQDYANVIFYLIKNGFSGKKLYQIEKEDIKFMYDNLCINSEIINSDNIKDYDEMLLIEKVGKNRINKIKKDDSLFLVLNYYNAHSVVKDSCFMFNYGYDVIIES